MLCNTTPENFLARPRAIHCQLQRSVTIIQLVASASRSRYRDIRHRVSAQQISGVSSISTSGIKRIRYQRKRYQVCRVPAYQVSSASGISASGITQQVLSCEAIHARREIFSNRHHPCEAIHARREISSNRHHHATDTITQQTWYSQRKFSKNERW